MTVLSGLGAASRAVASRAVGGARVGGAGFGHRPGRALGQGLVEYGLILGLSAILAVVILVVFGDQVADLVQWIAELVQSSSS